MSSKNNITQNSLCREWVNCPICGESDMRQEKDRDGNKLIFCTNHACKSNGGEYEFSKHKQNKTNKTE